MLEFAVTGIVVIIFGWLLLLVFSFIRGMFIGWKINRLMERGTLADIAEALRLYHRYG